MIKYGPVYIPCHTSDSEDWLSRYLDPEDVFQIDWQTRNHSLSHLGVQDPPPIPRIRVGVLHWPVCASSFAHMHLLATDDQIGEIRQVQDGRGYTLELTDGISGHVIRPTMYLLPPRPLASIPGYSQFWLLTLVDDRYYWWQQSTTIEANNSTTWSAYFNSLASSLGISIGMPSISSAYKTPSNRFTAYSQPIPVLIDAAARAVGLRFVSKIDGSYWLETPEDADNGDSSNDFPESYLAGRGQRKPTADPTNGQPNGSVNDQVPRVIIPDSVQVLFGRKRCGVYSTEPYRINVYLNPDTDEIGAFANNLEKPTTLRNYNATGSGSYPIVGDLTALFNSSASSVPSNYNELVLYAKQTAKDWYSWQCFYQDINHAGIINYPLHGCDEVAQWTYKKIMVSTRVTRARWNDRSLGKFRVSSEPGLLSAQLSPRDPRAEECSFSFNYGGYSGTLVESINIPVFQDFCITVCDPENFGECISSGGCDSTTEQIQIFLDSGVYGTFFGMLVWNAGSNAWILNGPATWSGGLSIPTPFSFFCNTVNYELMIDGNVWVGGTYNPATGVGFGTIEIVADTNVTVTLQGGTCSGTGTGSGEVCTGISEIKVRVRDWNPTTQSYEGVSYCVEPEVCTDEFCLGSDGNLFPGFTPGQTLSGGCCDAPMPAHITFTVGGVSINSLSDTPVGCCESYNGNYLLVGGSSALPGGCLGWSASLGFPSANPIGVVPNSSLQCADDLPFYDTSRRFVTLNMQASGFLPGGVISYRFTLSFNLSRSLSGGGGFQVDLANYFADVLAPIGSCPQIPVVLQRASTTIICDNWPESITIYPY